MGGHILRFEVPRKRISGEQTASIIKIYDAALRVTGNGNGEKIVAKTAEEELAEEILRSRGDLAVATEIEQIGADKKARP